MVEHLSNRGVIVNRKSMLRRGGEVVVGLQAPSTDDRDSDEKAESASALIPA